MIAYLIRILVLKAGECLLVNIHISKVVFAVDPESRKGEGRSRGECQEDVEIFDCHRVESILEELL